MAKYKRLSETQFWLRRWKGVSEKGEEVRKAWWLYLPFENVALVILLVLNFLVVGPLFRLQGSPNDFSAPVIPFVARMAARLFGVDFSRAVVWLILLFGSFGVVSLYFFVHELMGRRLSGLLAAVAYSLPLVGGFPLWVRHGLELSDGSHVAALALTPWVAYCALRFLKTGRFNFAFWGSLGTVLVALVSPFGAFALLVILVVCAFSEILLGQGRVKFFRLLVCLIFALGLSAFWYNPVFVKWIFWESLQGKALISVLRNLIPISFFTLPILGTLGLLIFERKPDLQPLLVSLGLFFAFFFLNLGGRLSQRASEAPSRFTLEFWLAASFVGSILATHVFDFLRRAKKIRGWVLKEGVGERLSLVFITGLLMVCVFLILKAIFQPVELESYGQVFGLANGKVAGVWGIRQEVSGGLAVWGGWGITALTGGLMLYLRKKFSFND